MRKPRNNRKPNTKRKGNTKHTNDDLEDFSDSRSKDRKSTNDPAWYASNPQLLKDAASYPFSQPLGRRFATNSGTVTTYQTIPGICVLRCAPAFGFGGRIDPASLAVTADVNNPINVAAAELYTWVRHKNSGAKNYEAADLMIYICAMSQVYSAITWGMRIYGLARMFEQRNRYMPLALIQANGVDPYSVINNLADYRYRMNVIINKVASLKVPAGIPLFNRQAFLYQNVYSEGLSVKDQLYMYAPEYFLRFGLNASGAGELATQEVIPVPTSAAPLTYNQVIDIIDRMFQAIWDEEDFATMSGDIDKAFEGRVLTLNSMNEDYGLIPIYDEMVLTQMKNSRMTREDYNSALHQVAFSNYTTVLVPLNYQMMPDSSSSINSRQMAMDYLHCDHPLSINAIEPEPSVVIESTRMFAVEEDRVTLPDANGVDQTISYLACGTEFVRRAFYGFFNAGSQAMDWNEMENVTQFNDSMPIVNVKAFMFKASLLKSFKFAPEHWVYHTTITTGTIAQKIASADIQSAIFEVDNYTTVGPQELMKMHESAILSLLHVGSYGSNAKM